MRHLKPIAAAMALLALNACVAFVVPIPVSSTTTTQDTSDDERRRPSLNDGATHP